MVMARPYTESWASSQPDLFSSGRKADAKPYGIDFLVPERTGIPRKNVYAMPIVHIDYIHAQVPRWIISVPG
jgi:hypothetical protein